MIDSGRPGCSDARIAEWLDAVRDGSASMSQRNRASIERQGSLAAATAAACDRGVHLAELTDDRGNVLVAASRLPIRSLG